MVNFDSPLGINANITLGRLNDNEFKRINFNEIINNPLVKPPMRVLKKILRILLIACLWRS